MEFSRTQARWLLAGPLILVGSAALFVVLANGMAARQAAFYGVVGASVAALVSLFAVALAILEHWGELRTLGRRDHILLIVGSSPAVLAVALATYVTYVGS